MNNIDNLYTEELLAAKAEYDDSGSRIPFPVWYEEYFKKNSLEH